MRTRPQLFLMVRRNDAGLPALFLRMGAGLAVGRSSVNARIGAAWCSPRPSKAGDGLRAVTRNELTFCPDFILHKLS
jgi:hypothetical protein